MDTVGTVSMPRIFLSFSPEDIDFVIWLSESLRSLGHNIHIDKDDALAGVQTFNFIQQALDQSEVMLFVMTPHALKSREVNSEWMYFFDQPSKKLIPILLAPPEPPDRINYLLASLQYVDFYKQDHNIALGVLHHTLQLVYHELYVKVPDLVLAASGPQPHQSFTDHLENLPLAVGYGDVVQIHTRFPVDRYLSWHQQAQRELKILSTWTGVTNIENYGDLLLDTVRRGVLVQILLLDPSSEIARQRSLDLHLGSAKQSVDTEKVPRTTRANIQRFADLYPELDGLSGQLELRLYSVSPPFALYIADEGVLVGFFVHSARMTDFPVLEVRLDSVFGEQLQAEFDRIWNNSTPIDLSPVFAPHVTEANLALIEPLSTRELQILDLIVAGLSNQEIASRLVITMATVKKHINNLYSKLGVRSRAQAIRQANHHGLTR